MDFFNKKRVAELEASLLEKTRELNDALAKLKEFERDPDVPWVQISSDGFDKSKGVKIAMDWNDAFIDYLERMEIQGPTAEAAVQRWLAMANLYLIEQLENEAIEKDDRGTVQDVVKDY